VKAAVVAAVLRAGLPADDGVLLHFDGFWQARRFALRWQRIHPEDRIALLGPGLARLMTFEAGAVHAHPPFAQPGNSAPGTES
jgi:hypothetical protein